MRYPAGRSRADEFPVNLKRPVLIIVSSLLAILVGLILWEVLQYNALLGRLSPQGRDDAFALGWGFLRRLDQGTDRYAYNICRGEQQGEPLFVFDYHYRTGSGKNKEHHRATFLMLILREAFPHLLIAPQSLAQLTTDVHPNTLVANEETIAVYFRRQRSRAHWERGLGHPGGLLCSEYACGPRAAVGT